jgi:hypothetical protein
VRTKGFKVLWSLTLLLGFEGIVCADLAQPGLSSSDQNPALVHSENSTAAANTPTPGKAGQYDPAWLGTDTNSSLALDAKVPVQTPQTAKKIKQLPGVSDSTVLFLYALGSMGVLQIGQSARKLNFGNLPGWLHTGGPKQIGHARAVDIDLSLYPLPLVLNPGQPVTKPLVSYRQVPEAPPRFESEYYLTNTDPRGPPVLSFN